MNPIEAVLGLRTVRAMADHARGFTRPGDHTPTRQAIIRNSAIRRANTLLRALGNDATDRDFVTTYGEALWWLKKAEHAHLGELDETICCRIRAGVDPDLLKFCVTGEMSV